MAHISTLWTTAYENQGLSIEVSGDDDIDTPACDTPGDDTPACDTPGDEDDTPACDTSGADNDG